MQENNNNAQPPLLSDAELETEIKKLAPKTSVFFALMNVFLFLMFVLHIPSFGTLTIPLFICAVIFGVLSESNRRKLKKLISDNIIRSVIADKVALLKYAPEEHIGQELIKQTELISRWNRSRGSDLIVGEYRGVKFDFSDIHLERVSGGKNKSRITMFKGQWLILELAKEIPWEVKLREREKGDKKLKSDIETENMEFNEKFQIETTDPHTAFYVLTPHFMEYIMNADRRANSKTYINAGGRQIHIALHNGRDLFEFKPGKQKSIENINILREQMKWDLNYITGIIDEFLLNERLFNSREQGESV